MWKWLWAILVLAILLPLVGPVIPVHAASSVNITIYASGYIAGAPGNFTISYVSDYELGISWTLPAGTNNTMVRAAFGHVPEDRDDGYEVYYGPANNCTDDSVSLAAPDVVYYRAWSQRDDGVWSNLFSSGSTEGFMSLSFLFIGLLAMSLTLTLACFRWKDILLSYAAGLTWLAIGFWWILGDITNLGLDDPWTKILVFIPFIMFFVIMIKLMGTEIEMEGEGMKWKEYGRKPQREKLSKYEAYKKELHKRTRR